MAKLREDMDDTSSNTGKTTFNKESENMNSVKKLHKMLSSNSMRGSSIEEERNGNENPENEKSSGDKNKRNDFRNISEEKDETTSDERKRESKLIDFSPDQVRPGKWPEEEDPDRISEEQNAGQSIRAESIQSSESQVNKNSSEENKFLVISPKLN
jgi:hypothetical protein